MCGRSSIHLQKIFFLRSIGALGTHGEVERVLKIRRRFAHAELLLLKDQVRLLVLIEARPTPSRTGHGRSALRRPSRTDRARGSAIRTYPIRALAVRHRATSQAYWDRLLA